MMPWTVLPIRVYRPYSVLLPRLGVPAVDVQAGVYVAQAPVCISASWASSLVRDVSSALIRASFSPRRAHGSWPIRFPGIYPRTVWHTICSFPSENCRSGEFQCSPWNVDDTT